ncbi:MAG: helix-turn-helix transcriptional regulator [Halanaerobiales bacterium]|nr:helix-turn-helix transcriptional regulator [Halanaerobiales bacterium]
MKLFNTYGIDATTMEQIAKEVDIAKGTLYNYFPVKEAIISAYIQQSFKENDSERILQFQKMPNSRARMILIFSILLEGVERQKELFEKYLVYQMQRMVSFQKDESEKSGLSLLGSKIIELGQKSAEIRTDLSLIILTDLFEFSFIEVVKQFYMEPEKFIASEAIESCVDLFINGVNPKKL